MKTEIAPGSKKVHFVSLGCPKNLVDAEIMAGTLMKDGYQVVNDAEDADTVIVNTCGFIEESKSESISKILEMGQLKEEGKISRLVVSGCLVQRYKQDLVEEMPEADIFVGSGQFQQINKILKANEAGDRTRTFFNLPTYLQEESTPRVNSQPGHRAYLKISEGCLKRCAFCAIPLIRGNLQSRTLASVINEAKLLVAGGVREINIISHDFTDYGWDLRRKDPAAPETPARLLAELAKIQELKWIRLLYLYPDGIDDEMLSVIEANPKICRYFDMPLQHISNPMLKAMNRKMTREEIEVVLSNIRKRIPDAVIRTQFIVGYPGETEQDFEELMDFIQEQQFDRIGCFKYSPEEGTPGGKLPNQIDDETKDRRWNQLMAAAQKISRKKHRAMIGRTLEVVVEGFSEETELLVKARSSQQAPDIDGVVLINEGEAAIGDFVKVKISASMDYDLVGSIVDEETVQ